MAINLELKLTLDGKDAFWNSKKTGVQLDITHIQFGTRNRVPTGEESLLNQPKQSTKVQNGSKIGPDQVRILATMPGLENYNVNEIGLWSGEPEKSGSILIAYTSVRTGYIAQMVTGIDLVFAYDMVLSTENIDQIRIVKDTDQSSTFALLAEHVSDRNSHPFYVTLDTAQTITSTKTFTSKAVFNGGLKGELEGNAATATQLKTARTFSFSGAATGSLNFNGTQNVSAVLTLANSGVVANTYGSNLKIPVLTVNAKGLLTSVSEQNLPLINDLNTGGANNILSAEQGKQLNQNKISHGDYGLGKTLSLPNGKNFSDITEDNSFWMRGNAPPADSPFPSASKVMNIGTSAWNTQLGFAAYDNRMALRARRSSGGEFLPWRELAFTDSNITGNASTATKLATARTVQFSGAANGSFSYDGTANSSCILTLANSGVVAGTYGNNITVPVFTVDAKGLVTVAATQPIRNATTAVTGLVQLNDSLISTSTTLAATANAVKQLNDKKIEKNGAFLDAFTGRVDVYVNAESTVKSLAELPKGTRALAGTNVVSDAPFV
ncbi:MAG: tail fiber protein, partial [Acinetobacter sp.]|nr:tail fiber protein [Acinetobacter sp.]